MISAVIHQLSILVLRILSHEVKDFLGRVPQDPMPSESIKALKETPQGSNDCVLTCRRF
jgi:hypothetical protein